MAYKRINCKDFNPKPIKMLVKYFSNSSIERVGEQFITLDTETSHNEDNTIGWIYQWAFTYNHETVWGRKPSELIECLDKIRKVNILTYQERIKNQIVVYVHNLSYDFEYIKQWLREYAAMVNENKKNRAGFTLSSNPFCAEHETTLAVGSHKVLSWQIAGLEFRCSYRLSGYSLAKWAKNLNAKGRKKEGFVDYKVTRYQDTELTEKDFEYMFADVEVLAECIDIQMSMHNDTIRSIPLTVTGYVRREARNAYREDKKNRLDFLNTRLEVDDYLDCREAFSGGLTHGNRFLSGVTLRLKEDERLNYYYDGSDYSGTGHFQEIITKSDKNHLIKYIKHRDFASHYPSQQRYYYAPCTKFVKVYDVRNHTDNPITLKEVLPMIKTKCCLITVRIDGMQVKEDVTMPYAQFSKFSLNKEGGTKLYCDNGRVLRMDGATVITCTEIDLKWILKQYRIGGLTFLTIRTARKGKFPKYLQDTVDKFFFQKSDLKAQVKELEEAGVHEDDDTMIDLARTLMIAKGMLNGIYGMSATDPVRDIVTELVNGEWRVEHSNKFAKDIIAELLDNFYDSRNSFMSYQYGVWTTANARNELMEFIEAVGYENFIYCDTDSIFYFSNDEIEAKIEGINAHFREVDDETGCYITTSQGKRIYYNQFDLEKEDIRSFRFLHAKCYAFETWEKDKLVLHCTIAGVAKKVKKWVTDENGNKVEKEYTRVGELGCIDNLKEGYTFVDCGGTSAVYNFDVPHEIMINGHLTEVASCVIIVDSTKKLNSQESLEEIDWDWSVYNECMETN